MILINNEWEQIDNLENIKKYISENIDNDLSNELDNIIESIKNHYEDKIEEIEYEKELTENSLYDYEDKLDRIEKLCMDINKKEILSQLENDNLMEWIDIWRSAVDSILK
jgi:hypothetical protein